MDELIDAQGNVTSYSYLTDGTGLLDEVNFGGVTRVEKTYDPMFPIEIGSEIGPENDPIVTSLAYDRYVHLIEVNRSRSSSGDSEVSRFEFDAGGRPSHATFSRDGVVESDYRMKYNARDQIKSKTYRIGSYSGTVAWNYLANGLLRAMTYPTGNVIQHQYATDSNSLESITLKLPSGGIKKVADFENIDSSGRPLTIKAASGLPKGLTIDRTFSSTGRESSRHITSGKQQRQP